MRGPAAITDEEEIAPLVIKLCVSSFPFICRVHYGNGSSVNSWDNLSSRDLMNLKAGRTGHCTTSLPFGSHRQLLCQARSPSWDRVLGEQGLRCPNYCLVNSATSQLAAYRLLIRRKAGAPFT